jgi:hypothetical protein
VPDPSPELRKELYKFDTEYRHGTEKKFAELEKLADELAKQFPEKDDQARIWYEVAHVAGQSGIDKHPERVKKYAAKCLAISRDPIQRGQAYSYLASAVDLNGTAFPKGRREAAIAQNSVATKRGKQPSPFGFAALKMPYQRAHQAVTPVSRTMPVQKEEGIP